MRRGKSREEAAGDTVKFGVILADPPWQFKCWSDYSGVTGPKHGKNTSISARLAAAHYSVQGAEWINSLPVASVADDDCVLFLWSVWPMLPEAMATIEAWGFTFKTLAFDWVKVTSNGHPRINLGYWTRANSEPCLLATRGKPKRLDKGVAQVIVSGLGEHSEKPEEQYDRIERLVEGPYLELFHRPRHGLLGPRDGWTFLGNEVTGRDMREDLELLANQCGGEAVIRKQLAKQFPDVEWEG